MSELSIKSTSAPDPVRRDDAPARASDGDAAAPHFRHTVSHLVGKAVKTEDIDDLEDLGSNMSGDVPLEVQTAARCMLINIEIADDGEVSECRAVGGATGIDKAASSPSRISQKHDIETERHEHASLAPPNEPLMTHLRNPFEFSAIELPNAQRSIEAGQVVDHVVTMGPQAAVDSQSLAGEP